MYKNYTIKSLMPFYEQKGCKLILCGALFLTLLFAGSVVRAQTITATFKKAPLKVVIKELKKQSHYDFVITDELLNKAAPVDLGVNKADLTTVLDLLFKERPLSYTIREKTIVIREKTVRSVKQESLESGYLTVFGTVKNEDNEALEGATVRVKGKEISTMTVQNGVYSLRGVEKGDVLVITYLGYNQAELPAASKFEQVMLKHATSKLDEVQVIFNGKSSLRTSTGSQITITHEQLAVSPAPNILDALQGLVPGLTITQNGPNASSNYAITLRGMNALGSSGSQPSELPYLNEPLILLDGFPLAHAPASSQGQIGLFFNSPNNSTNGLSVLFSLNPADVENVTVLKDADATSIYGTRGANGVILITTRHARGGDLVASGSLEYGLTTYAQKLNLMNTEQYLAMRRLAFKNDGVTPSTSNAPDLTLWSQTKDTNWQKEVLGNKPTYTANFNVSGGKGSTTFNANGGYFLADQGIKGGSINLPNNYSEQRTSFSLSTQSTSANGRLHLDSHYSISVDNSNLPSGSLENLIFLAPNAPDLYDAHGNINWNDWASDTFGYPAAASSIQLPLSMKSTNTNTSLKFSYEILNRLNFSLQGGYSTTNLKTFSESSSAATTDPSTVALYNSIGLGGILRSSYFNGGQFTNFTLEPTLDYARKIGKSFLSMLAGMSYNDNSYDSQSFIATGFSSDNLEKSISSATTVTPLGQTSQQKLASVYARINYKYDDRYILMLSGRRDGSSAFGPGRQWGNFGSAGVAWVFSDEDFAKPLKGKFFSFGKLRASYGITGSPVTSSFGYESTYAVSSLNTYEGSTTFQISQASNANIQWASTKKLNIGTDIGFLNDQLVIAADVYHTRTSNMIINNYLPATSGLSFQMVNFPGLVQNKGLEISLNYRSEPNHKVTWSLGGNIAMNRNKLVSFPNIKNTIYSTYYTVGQPISRARVYNLPPLNSQTGTFDYTVANVNSPNGYAFVNIAPKFSGGIQQTIGYKGFSLALNYEYRQQSGFNGYNTGSVPGGFNYGSGNQLVDVVDNSWQNPGDNAKYPKLSNSDSEQYFLNSNILETEVFYIALKNARLAYNLQKSAIKALGIGALSFNISATNLFYITNYKGVNPVTPVTSISTSSLMRRSLLAGINASF